ncbi:nuclear transport factor 2 family protein [Glycomyces tarimensis]
MSIHSKLSPVRRATVLAGGAFAMTLALGACGGGSDTPGGTVENFLDNGIEDFATAFTGGDYDEAVSIGEDYFCAADVEEIQTAADEVAAMSEEERAQMEAMMSSEETLPEDWSYEVGETTEDGDTATVEVEMTENGETSTETIDLVKEEDQWRICGFM